MKKISIILASLAFIFLSVFAYNQLNPNILNVKTDRNLITSFQQLSSESDLIVKVKVLADSINYLDDSKNPETSLGHTITSVKIVKSFKVPNGFNDSAINVMEPYWFYSNAIGEKNIICMGEYRPLNTDETYILFLKKNTDGSYRPSGMDQGKYVINNKTKEVDNIDNLSAGDLEIATDYKLYKDLFKDVLINYKD